MAEVDDNIVTVEYLVGLVEKIWEGNAAIQEELKKSREENAVLLQKVDDLSKQVAVNHKQAVDKFAEQTVKFNLIYNEVKMPTFEFPIKDEENLQSLNIEMTNGTRFAKKLIKKIQTLADLDKLDFLENILVPELLVGYSVTNRKDKKLLLNEPSIRVCVETPEVFIQVSLYTKKAVLPWNHSFERIEHLKLTPSDVSEQLRKVKDRYKKRVKLPGKKPDVLQKDAEVLQDNVMEDAFQQDENIQEEVLQENFDLEMDGNEEIHEEIVYLQDEM